ncbi:MAG TPA: serine hydrolase domain-containing protein [Candidatus Eisenbacteria bacterium]|nr:serine hydrolase domain-containing protein [Candidatus Eisenbacteria bacterium]
MSTVDAQLGEKLTEAAERFGVPGAAAGVCHRGEERYAFTGVTSVDNPLPVEEGTLFQIGSTTKTFTATAIMRLVEAGRIDLAAAVRTYVPELRLKDERVAARVTVLHLLNHTAGWTGDFFTDTGDGDDALARYVEAMAGLNQVSPLGTIASYNNASLCLAGRVIEKVTGQTFEAALRQLVLEPLGLEHSYLFPAEIMTLRFVAGHSDDDPPTVRRPWRLPRNSNAAGGLISTAADQVRYARFHLGAGAGVLRQETLELMRRPTFAMNGAAIGDRVGISWLLRDVEGVTMVGHGGTTNGQLSLFQMVPERDFAITVLTNSIAGARLHRELLDWALATYLGVVRTDPVPLPLSAEQLREYAGEYRSDTTDVTITVEGERLIALGRLNDAEKERLRPILGDVPDQPPAPIGILPDDGFLVVDGKGKGGRGTFVREDGRITGVNMGGRLALRV